MVIEHSDKCSEGLSTRMNRIRGNASPSRTERERGRHTNRAPHVSLAECVEATIRNAATLLEDGYQLVPSRLAPLSYMVFKPGQVLTDTPAYMVELYYDEAEGDPLQRRAWSYRCSCELFRQQEQRRTGDACRCKHGDRARTEWLRHLSEVAALLGYVPDIPRTCNRFATANIAQDCDQPSAPGDDNPWPTQRAFRRADRPGDNSVVARPYQEEDYR
jgi:hypothetical protein